MSTVHANFWKKIPFVKFLLATITGILLQWYYPFAPILWESILLTGIVCQIIFFFLPLSSRYRLRFIIGTIIHLLFLSLGALLAWQKDIRNDPEWIGHHYKDADAFIAQLSEAPVEKPKSIKATATLRYIVRNNKQYPVKGNIILYIEKNAGRLLNYGQTIIFRKTFQPILNTANPGGFNYQQYALFHSITHQIYLTGDDFEILSINGGTRLNKWLQLTKKNILTTLRRNIKSKQELGLAEALLVGYKDDLDPALVQSYTNTGVVHIIAISGLHLGLIYWLLSFLLQPLQKRKAVSWLRPLLLISCLWAFSLLAGAQPSVLRSALMFSCMVIADTLARKTSIYNTMAVSAFILLCINPYWLWDIGFQLSYSAVLSIVIFMQPVYNCIYISNKLLDFIWKMNAVTIAAQLLTIPLCIYHFHQFPNYFMLTNFVAVPLSSIILLAEILLCTVSAIHPVALFIGKQINSLTWLMNTYIERVASLPFSLWTGMQLSLVQALLLLLFIISICYWLIEKNKSGLKTGLIALLLFTTFRSLSFIKRNKQICLIVYNVTQRSAIDYIHGSRCFFSGDSLLQASGRDRNYYLQPSRTLYRVSATETLDGLLTKSNYTSFCGKRILLINEHSSFQLRANKLVVDLLVVSKKPAIAMKKLAAVFLIKQVVFDASVPAWKVRQWEKDCDSLHIPSHDVSIRGAFVMQLR